MKNSIQLMVFLITAILFAFSCNDSGVNPEDNLKPGRRDYVWTSDSLVHHNVGLGEIWGASPNDVWACGNAFDWEYRVWHYDGISWKPYKMPDWIDPRGIFGFSQNDIWIGTSTGDFWHYDGNTWKIHSTLEIEGYELINQEIFGISYDNIYALGFADSQTDYYGIIAHYNGTQWRLLSIPKYRVSFLGMAYIKEENKYLVRAWNMDGNKPERLYKLDGLSLEELYEGDEKIFLTQIDEEPFFVKGKRIYQYENGELHVFQDYSSKPSFGGGIFGKNKKDIFTANNDGIGHFNGEDLITIYPHNVYTVDGILFEKDVFFLITSGTSTNIVHGKLSEAAE